MGSNASLHPNIHIMTCRWKGFYFRSDEDVENVFDGEMVLRIDNFMFVEVVGVF